MRRLLYIVLMLIPLLAQAQQTDEWQTTSEKVASNTVYYTPDTTNEESEYQYYVDLSKKPDAMRAVWLGAILPGAGQIYNQSYWKLPIVYGAFVGCAYAIIWNNARYTDYHTAYRDILLDEELSTDPMRSYNAILPEGYDIDRMGGRSQYTQTLQRYQNNYRRYRDLSIVATVLVYALSLVDAFVDAQLFDFDISPDLSMQVEPVIYQDMHNQRSAELKLAITF